MNSWTRMCTSALSPFPSSFFLPCFLKLPPFLYFFPLLHIPPFPTFVSFPSLTPAQCRLPPTPVPIFFLSSSLSRWLCFTLFFCSRLFYSLSVVQSLPPLFFVISCTVQPFHFPLPLHTHPLGALMFSLFFVCYPFPFVLARQPGELH